MPTTTSPLPTPTYPIYGTNGPRTSWHDGLIAIIVFSALTGVVLSIACLKCYLRRRQTTKTRREAQERQQEFEYLRGVRNGLLVELVQPQTLRRLLEVVLKEVLDAGTNRIENRLACFSEIPDLVGREKSESLVCSARSISN
ncbi:uncharacterized protein BDZ99DRAFT_517925 [Mytilinidion resinicola]|uniref:Uncharacterized protein n=1 Tax=Mytilinidion resinicola TaxID=574789 RepID=A0A6A6YSY1_9PEZI|nr:uncharacterized protein BDZ99DRAFT_517925 [Mytilinidion resinicola]KAF2812056.1 hypothetical protein BDZ99DRAFT_517925 [Mytilinidion resinicola]